MKYDPKYFVHIENCSCNLDKIKTTVESAVVQKTPWMLDIHGKGLFSVDSFGFRGRIPGESKECYKAMSKERAKSLRNMYD